jgi:hypothetical protein
MMNWTAELLDPGITEVDPDRSDLEAMLAKYWKEPNTKQLNESIAPGSRAPKRAQACLAFFSFF